MRVAVPLKATAYTLTLIALVFAVGTLGGFLYKSAFGLTRSSGIVRLLDVDDEASIPMWFSSVLFLVGSGLLAAIGASKRASGRPGALQWYGLAAIFLGLSIDEATMIHEMVETVMDRAFDVDDPLRVLWVIPYTAFAGAVLLAYRGFLRDLPARTRWLMLAAGAVYVAGAVGVEVVGISYLRTQEPPGLAYVVAAIGEELLEMGGLILFVYALLDYIHRHVGEVKVSIDP